MKANGDWSFNKFIFGLLAMVYLIAVVGMHQLWNRLSAFEYLAKLSNPIYIHGSEPSPAPLMEEGCGPPQLELWHKDALKDYMKMPPVDCVKKTNQSSKLNGSLAFYVDQGRFLQQQLDLDLLDMRCCYRAFFFKNDRRNRYSEDCVKITSARTEIPPTIDFIWVKCHDKKWGNVSYQDTFPLVHPYKAANLSSPTSTSTSSSLNVIIIGLDAISRLTFRRQLPLSTEYLVRELGAISMEGYSNVGLGTAKNLLPMLTGISYAEVRSGCGKGQHLDMCPFVWKDYTKLGYITAFMDDCPTFSPHWWKEQAFLKSPTTYYAKPNMVHQSIQKRMDHACYGPRLQFKGLLDFIESVSGVANSLGKPYFSMTWSDTLGHDKMNHLAGAEVPLLSFLRKFKASPARANTILLVVSDHGISYDKEYFGTPNGKLEYTMPLAYVVMPPWFPNKYQDKFANLKHNAHQVVTAYDIHKTLKDILYTGADENNNQVNNASSSLGTSLFEKIGRRKCVEAGISMPWCRRCYPDIPLNQSDPLVKAAALGLLNAINAQVEQYQHLCKRQTLKTARASSKWDSRDVSRELCNAHGFTDMSTKHYEFRLFFLNTSCNVDKETVDLVSVDMITNPRDTEYHGQVLVRRSRADGQVVGTFLTEKVMRLDHYRNTGICAPPHLQPFCICM